MNYPISKSATAILLALASSIIASSQTNSSLPQIDLDSPASPYISPKAHPCRPDDFGILDVPETKALLSDYDFEDFLPASCKKVDIPWLSTAIVIRLNAMARTVDDNREITLIQASPNSRTWLIPIINGMVGYAHTPDDPHNLAAFNDLLREAKFKPADDQIRDLSNLYQFIVGSEMAADRDPRPKKLRQALSVNDMESSLDHSNGFVDFTHRERFGDSGAGSYMVWEFRYAVDGEFARLVDVERRTLKDYNKFNK